MAQANYMQKYIQQAQNYGNNDDLTPWERAQLQAARQQRINQYVKDRNNGALLGDILSSFVTKYFTNMPDTTLPGGNSEQEDMATPTNPYVLTPYEADEAARAAGLMTPSTPTLPTNSLDEWYMKKYGLR